MLDRGTGSEVLDEETLKALADETVGAILKESARLPEREKRLVLGIVRQFSQRVSVDMTRIAWWIRKICTRDPADWPKDASERKRVSIDATCCQTNSVLENGRRDAWVSCERCSGTAWIVVYVYPKLKRHPL